MTAPGTVIAWVDGGVWVGTGDDPASGMYAPEEVTFLPEDRLPPDELT